MIARRIVIGLSRSLVGGAGCALLLAAGAAVTPSASEALQPAPTRLVHRFLQIELSPDAAFVASRVAAPGDFEAFIQAYDPKRVEAISGVPAKELERAAHLYAEHAPAAIVYGTALSSTQHNTSVHHLIGFRMLVFIVPRKECDKQQSPGQTATHRARTRRPPCRTATREEWRAR